MIKLFGEVPFKKIESTILKTLEKRIETIEDDKVLNTDLKLLAEEQVSKSILKKLDINFDERKYQISMKTIKGRDLPSGFDVRLDEDTSRAEVSYSFPFTNGDVELFSVFPKDAYISKAIIGNATNKEVKIYFQTTSQTDILSDDIKEKIIILRDIAINELKAAVKDINHQVDDLNESLYSKAEDLLKKKYNIAKRKRDQGNELE